MLSAINGNSSLQMINALNAFGGNKRVEPANSNFRDIDTSNGINLNDNDSLLDNINLDEIKNCAERAGDLNLTNDDIIYGLTYGRSVIADYVA